MDAIAQYMQQAGHTVVCVILVTVFIFTIGQILLVKGARMTERSFDFLVGLFVVLPAAFVIGCLVFYLI